MRSPRIILRTLYSSLRRRGLVGTLREIVRYVRDPLVPWPSDPAFDRLHGTDTDGVIMPAEMDVSSESRLYGTRYEATPMERFPTLLARVQADFRDYTFIDVGCGKGRTLLMAANYPFREIIGIEYSEQLCRIAERNIQRFVRPGLACSKLSVVCADATEYELPRVPLVMYLYNPFHEPIMRAFVESLGASLRAHPRKIHVIYNRPLQDELFASADFLVKRDTAQDLSIYESVAG